MKEHVPPIKDDVIDFWIDGTAIKNDNTEKEKLFKKKVSLKIEREERGIATEENSEIVTPQLVLAHTDTNKAKNSASWSNPSEIKPPKQSEEWRKGTTLITEDSMMAGLREPKLWSSEKIKVRFFPGAKLEVLMFYLIQNLKKSPATSLFILARMMRYIKMKMSFMKNSNKSKIWS